MTIAIFDLDKTITKFDTFIPFILYSVVSSKKFFTPCVTCLFWGLRLIFGLSSRKAAKEKFLLSVCRDGFTLDNLARRFVNWWGDAGIRSGFVQTLQYHRNLGHAVAIASASPDLYVRYFALKFAIPVVIASPCTYSVGDHPLLLGIRQNLLGVNKLDAVRKLYPHEDIYFYSDSLDDLPLLENAEHGFIVNPSKRALRLIKDTNIGVLWWKG